MKKIITLLIVSTFLFSCTNNMEETIENENTASGEVEMEANTGVIIEEKTSTGETMNNEKTASGEVETQVETSTELEANSNTESSTDEEVLDKEINDLLDGFIDSLDSYEK